MIPFQWEKSHHLSACLVSLLHLNLQGGKCGAFYPQSIIGMCNLIQTINYYLGLFVLSHLQIDKHSFREIYVESLFSKGLPVSL
jgi:hypothetical protein